MGPLEVNFINRAISNIKGARIRLIISDIQKSLNDFQVSANEFLGVFIKVRKGISSRWVR
jgi:hypothetical protein